MADGDKGALGRIGDAVATAVDVAGLAADLGTGLVGPTPDPFVAPAVEHTANVVQVEAPDWAYTTTDDLVQQAGEVLEAEAERDVEQALELGEMFESAEPDSALESEVDADAEDGLWADAGDVDAGDWAGDDGDVDAGDWAGDDGDVDAGDWATGDSGDAADTGDAGDASGGAW